MNIENMAVLFALAIVVKLATDGAQVLVVAAKFIDADKKDIATKVSAYVISLATVALTKSGLPQAYWGPELSALAQPLSALVLTGATMIVHELWSAASYLKVHAKNLAGKK